MKWKIILFALSLLIIFGLTLQNGPDSANLSSNFQILLYNLFSIETDSKLVRRFAHIPEYFLLGIATALLVKDIRSIFVCLVISFTDEVVKSFIPYKEFDGIDMCFDLVGYTLGITLTLLIQKHIMSE